MWDVAHLGLSDHISPEWIMPDLYSKVCNLTSGDFYQFRVFAANMAGVGKPSESSEAFLCEKWTMPEPGEEKMSLYVSSYNK